MLRAFRILKNWQVWLVIVLFTLWVCYDNPRELSYPWIIIPFLLCLIFVGNQYCHDLKSKH